MKTKKFEVTFETGYKRTVSAFTFKEAAIIAAGRELNSGRRADRIEKITSENKRTKHNVKLELI